MDIISAAGPWRHEIGFPGTTLAFLMRMRSEARNPAAFPNQLAQHTSYPKPPSTSSNISGTAWGYGLRYWFSSARAHDDHVRLLALIQDTPLSCSPCSGLRKVIDPSFPTTKPGAPAHVQERPQLLLGS
nr:hypothetical protein CFP56_52260 [Quercus suber]